jgi:hypothetical protein
MADDDRTLPDAYDLVPVDHTPQFSDAPIPKAGQTIQQPNVMGDITSMPGKVASAVGDVTGVTDAYKAATGQMTPDEAQMFALGALPMLAGGPEAKAVEGVAEDIAPAVAKGIRAYHGSPYDFNQFDLSKIGTGEGAQAYGHGLYFAENPQTSETYKNSLKWNSADWDDVHTGARHALETWPDDPIGAMQRIIANNRIYARPGNRHATDLEQNQKVLELLQSGAPVKAGPTGYMYEVNINADPEHFLDWDKPLSEQSPKVQEALLKLPGGEHIVQSKLPGSSIAPQYSESTQQLRDAGIPGIKYLDQGSRAIEAPSDMAGRLEDIGTRMSAIKAMPIEQQTKAISDEFQNLYEEQSALRDQLKKYRDANATRNYVVFNDRLIDIVKKYGLAGLVAGGASHFSTVPVDHQPDFDTVQNQEKYSNPIPGMATGGGVKGGVKIDASHDGPWMSCMSIDGATMYRNKNIPATANIKGKTMEVDDMLLHHEVPERADLEKLIEQFKARHHREPNTKERKGIYLKAHNRSGTPNERAHAKKIGVDWKAWSAWCRGEESKIEKMKFTNQPKDADVKPIPHSHGDLEAEDKAA